MESRRAPSRRKQASRRYSQQVLDGRAHCSADAGRGIAEWRCRLSVRGSETDAWRLDFGQGGGYFSVLSSLCAPILSFFLYFWGGLSWYYVEGRGRRSR